MATRCKHKNGLIHERAITILEWEVRDGQINTSDGTQTSGDITSALFKCDDCGKEIPYNARRGKPEWLAEIMDTL